MLIYRLLFVWVLGYTKESTPHVSTKGVLEEGGGERDNQIIMMSCECGKRKHASRLRRRFERLYLSVAGPWYCGCRRVKKVGGLL